MATRKTRGIDTSSLPSVQDLIALSQRPSAAEGINALTSGVTTGVDLATQLAQRKLAREKAVFEMQETIRKAKEEANQRQREQNIAAELGGTTPAHTRVAANIGGQPVLAKETKSFAEAGPARLQAALASAEPVQTTKDIYTREAEKQKSERDTQEATAMQNLKFEQAKELLRLKGEQGKTKGGKIPVSLINDKNLIENQIKQLREVESILTKKSQGPRGFVRDVASKVTLGNIAPDLRLYDQNRPAMAVSTYRALTGDTRLSDADAAQRALPLLPRPGEPAVVHKQKIKFLREGLERRNKILDQVSELAKSNDFTPEQLEGLRVTPLPTVGSAEVPTGEVDPNQFIEEE